MRIINSLKYTKDPTLLVGMTSLRLHVIIVVAAAMVRLGPEASQEVDEALEQMGVDAGVMVGQVVEHHLAGCHLVLLTTTPDSLITSIIIRHISKSVVAGMVVEAGWVFSQDQLVQNHLFQGLWGDTRTTCRGLIVDLTTNSSIIALRLAEAAGLWKLSETRVVAVGGRAWVKDVLLHHSLRNSLHALYLVLHDNTLHDPRRRYSSFRKIFRQDVYAASMSSGVWVYRRCMYCNNGEADVQVINHWVITPNIHNIHQFFQEQVQTLLGHKLRVVAVPHFPYMDFELNTTDPGGIVIQKDAIDTRLINTFSTALNFTFEIRAEPELSWGLQENGVFTGMMGQLQREETDFCTIAGPSPERLKVAEYLRGYPSDPMTVTSLKPSLLPENLSLIRPFTGELWLMLLLSVVVWGVILWLLQRAWQWMTGGRGVKLSTIFMYGCGALMEQSPPDPPVSVSGRKVSREEALQKVLEGHYTLIVWENNLIITIASHYTDSHGNTPYFISKKGVSIMAAFGWGFRKGAPFYQRFQRLMSRLEDAGLIKYWTQDVIATRVRENRAAAALNPQVVLGDTGTDNTEVVLGMQHLQGAFYVLFLGSFFAILILLWENLSYSRSLSW
nr:uncharacterized protein LOC128695285 [Cherax quadricarinatus]